MPDEDKKTVDIDTSGPDATIDIEETKDESVVETEAPEQETKTEETVKVEEKKQDENLEDYSKGVQYEIAHLYCSLLNFHHCLDSCKMHLFFH